MELEALLAEVEDIIRTMPPRETLRHPLEENFSWLGRVSACIEIWDSTKSSRIQESIARFHGPSARGAEEEFRKILTLLHQVRTDLRMKTIGPINEVIGHGAVFSYFDEIRKIVEQAKQDVLFIDPYLDSEFVSRYLQNIGSGVNIRFLARERLSTLLPAVEQYVKQTNANVSVRSSPGIHDRFVIIDRNSCYQSGASFKDGAKNAPTTITQITDAFPEISKTYEDMWQKAKIVLEK